MNPLARIIDRNFIKEVGFTKWLLRTLVRQFTKRVLRRDNYIRLPNGIQMCLPKDNAFASEVFVTNCNVDWGAEAVLTEEFPTHGVFLDVGAHIGYYSVLLSHKASRVYAFEPDPRNMQQLNGNVGSLSNVWAIPKAVCEQSGKVQLHLSAMPQLNSLGPISDSIGDLAVDAVSIDDFAADSGMKIDAIKTDMGGADLAALMGAQKTMLNDKPLILSELGYSIELETLARERHYVLFAFLRDPLTRRRSFGRIAMQGDNVAKMVFLVPQQKAEAFQMRWMRHCE